LNFLKRLNQLLGDEAFNIDKDFILIRKKKDDVKHSTPYTLLDLGYGKEEVVQRLKELTIKEYSEALIDRDDVNLPILFVFGKDINGKLIYIKLRIKGDQKKRILCVSFHYATWEMKFPYA
ncbi:MAG: hypothetical protein K5659_06480, partial [Lachnospiraceae bacterium]|nr:hypothetical protein [Lachnospiraceae bacterium]